MSKKDAHPPILPAEVAAIANVIETLILRWTLARDAGMAQQMAVAETVFVRAWSRLVPPQRDAEAITDFTGRIPRILAIIRAGNDDGPVGHG